jgi:mannosyltransferase OCH1-like enzyme
MKKISVLILLLLAGLLSLSLFKKEALPPAWIPFNLSMMKANPSFLNCYAKAEGRKWKWLKSLYEKGLAQSPTAHIPKIIHQIWLGGPLPATYKRWQETWQKKHPDWHYKLWTDLDLVDFPFTDRSRFERALDIREKADILRYDILLHFGGLYVDIDFECLKSFEPIHATCDFYTGLQATLPHQNEPLMGNDWIDSQSSYFKILLARDFKKSSWYYGRGNSIYFRSWLFEKSFL